MSRLRRLSTIPFGIATRRPDRVMNTGQRSARRLATGNTHLSRDIICNSCRHRLNHQSRRYAATASVTIASELPPLPLSLAQKHTLPAATSSKSQHIPPVTSTRPQRAYRVLASPVLSRPPLLTRDLTPFEQAFYLYQKRLNERQAMPFTRYFYYKKGTPADAEWKRKVKARKAAGRDVGAYDAYGDEAWNDEVLVGDCTAQRESQVEALIRDAEGKLIIEGEVLASAADKDGQSVAGEVRQEAGQRREMARIAIARPAPRVTEADRTGDLSSLSRRMDRSLYLLVRDKQGQWRFPQDRVYGRENMHQAAERILMQAAGINMNTWVVSPHPVGHLQRSFAVPEITKTPPNTLVWTSKETMEREEYGEKVFFMKARIMSGQADLSKNAYGDQEFQWLVKEELAQKVHPKYWSYVKNMLPER